MLIYYPVWFVCCTKMSDSTLRLVRLPVGSIGTSVLHSPELRNLEAAPKTILQTSEQAMRGPRYKLKYLFEQNHIATSASSAMLHG